MLWILQLLPDWIYYCLTLIGVLGLIATWFLKFIPIPFVYMYKTPIQILSAIMVVFGVYMTGAIANEHVWKERVAKLESENAKLQVKSEKVNTEVITKYVTKREIIHKKGEEQIRYIDREIVKYNDICKLPKEVFTLHNEATKVQK